VHAECHPSWCSSRAQTASRGKASVGGLAAASLLCDFSRLRLISHTSHMPGTHDAARFERAFPLPSPTGNIELKIQQGGAGRFYIIATLPAVPQTNQIVLSVPSELADSLTHAIGKAADYSGE
jgi:hypothetical protein